MKALRNWQKSLEKEIDTGFKRKKDGNIFELIFSTFDG